MIRQCCKVPSVGSFRIASPVRWREGGETGKGKSPELGHIKLRKLSVAMHFLRVRWKSHPEEQ